MKILKKQEGKSNYEFLNENLKLIKEDVNINEPDDCSYVFGGFCPITIRLIESFVKRGWNPIREILKRIPGEYEFPANEKEVLNLKARPNFVLLVFIGGVTYAEIAAIRYLNKTLKGILLFNPEHKFIILTTHLINGKKFIEDLREKFEPALSMKDYITQFKQLAHDK
jgi:hypothetical protein